MTMMKTLLGACATLAITATGALADPAVIFDLGGKFDRSFNESAFNGAERWAEETGGEYREIELQNELVATARKHGVRIMGPNIYGFYYTLENLCATFNTTNGTLMLNRFSVWQQTVVGVRNRHILKFRQVLLRGHRLKVIATAMTVKE